MVPLSMAGRNKFWLKSWHEMSDVKVFATPKWMDSHLTGQTNTTHYTDPYDTHMDGGKKVLNF